MAIVRTTPQETGSGAPAPNGVKAPAATQSATPVAKNSTREQGKLAPGRPAVGRVPAARSGAPTKPAVFVNETMTELRRVVWPSRAEVQAGTIVTIGLLVFFALFIFGLDSIMQGVFTALGLYDPQSNAN